MAKAKARQQVRIIKEQRQPLAGICNYWHDHTPPLLEVA